MVWNRNQRRIADAKTDCYRVYDNEGQLLYVGASVNVFRRLQQHRPYAAWWPAANRVVVHQYANRRDARYVEALAIRDEAPVYNVTVEWSEIYAARGRDLPEPIQTLDLFREGDDWWHYVDEETV